MIGGASSALKSSGKLMLNSNSIKYGKNAPLTNISRPPPIPLSPPH